jgi:ketosteroid isomerase-like protein
MLNSSQADVAAAVQGVLAGYAHALDAGRTDDLVALFAPEGTAEIAGLGLFRGHEEIRAAYARLVPTRPQLHLTGNTVLTAWSDDEATAISSFAFFQRGSTGWSVPVTGRYDDVLRKAPNGSWLIASKSTTYVA